MNAILAKLRDVMKAHDAERHGVLSSPNYRSQQPAHPNRGYSGHGQVAKNWGNTLRGVPDMTVESLAEATDGATVWRESAMTGHRLDGSPFEMRRVMITGLTDDGPIPEQQVHLEPVERDGAAIDETAQRLAKTAQ